MLNFKIDTQIKLMSVPRIEPSNFGSMNGHDTNSATPPSLTSRLISKEKIATKWANLKYQRGQCG
jgi:hypothetical protein